MDPWSPAIDMVDVEDVSESSNSLISWRGGCRNGILRLFISYDHSKLKNQTYFRATRFVEGFNPFSFEILSRATQSKRQ